MTSYKERYQKNKERRKEYMIKWRNEHKEQLHEYNIKHGREYYSSHKEEAMKKSKERVKNNPEKRRLIQKKYRINHVEQRRLSTKRLREEKGYMKIHCKTKYYIDKYKLRPTNCSICGKEGVIISHHPNYNIWNSIVFVCNSCHTNIHNGNIECPEPIDLLSMI